MPAFMKLGDIKGESQDAFVFKPMKTEDTDPPATFEVSKDDGGTEGLLLPAVQSFMDDGSPKGDDGGIHQVEWTYTEVEWTY